ncbi:MAG: hypothetical protein K9H16_01370 [Bacteroidales bacterium]|nr:hypothetical protein [Bacteroidales bacterium]
MHFIKLTFLVSVIFLTIVPAAIFSQQANLSSGENKQHFNVSANFSYGNWRFEEPRDNSVLDRGTDGLNGSLNGLPFRTTTTPVDTIPYNGLSNTRSLNLN